MSKQKIYVSIIEKIFRSRFKPGIKEIDFEREKIVKVGKEFKSKNFESK